MPAARAACCGSAPRPRKPPCLPWGCYTALAAVVTRRDEATCRTLHVAQGQAVRRCNKTARIGKIDSKTMRVAADSP
jgi:hypothetical protein